jgi:integrase/recombinase XerD
MKLHGLRKKTIDSSCLTLRRVANFFGRCPDNITSGEYRAYFKNLTERYSWSTVKVDLSSLQFFHRYVLDREMEWVKIVRPPRVRRLPVIATREEVHLLINTVRKLRYRVFFVVVYSFGLRISEGLGLEVADIDGPNKRVHLRDGKGGRDRYVPLPEITYAIMGRFWTSHRQPRLLFPSPVVSQFMASFATSLMHASGVQAAFKAARLDCKIEKQLTLVELCLEIWAIESRGSSMASNCVGRKADDPSLPIDHSLLERDCGHHATAELDPQPLIELRLSLAETHRKGAAQQTDQGMAMGSVRTG